MVLLRSEAPTVCRVVRPGRDRVKRVNALGSGVAIAAVFTVRRWGRCWRWCWRWRRRRTGSKIGSRGLNGVRCREKGKANALECDDKQAVSDRRLDNRISDGRMNRLIHILNFLLFPLVNPLVTAGLKTRRSSREERPVPNPELFDGA